MTRPGPHVAAPSDVADVRTIRSGRAYRVDIDGDVYFFEIDHDDTAVFVRTRTHAIGGYFLDRFGNDLSGSATTCRPPRSAGS